MSQDQPEAPSSNKTVLWIVGIIAAVVVVVILVCGGVAYLAINVFQKVAVSARDVLADLQAAPATAQQFLSDLAANQVDAAYARTSAAYQAQWSKEAFRDYLAKHPLLTTHTSTTSQTLNITPPTATIKETLIGPKGTDSCTMQLTKEGNQWKINQLSVP
jgi:hypothetical protein